MLQLEELLNSSQVAASATQFLRFRQIIGTSAGQAQVTLIGAALGRIITRCHRLAHIEIAPGRIDPLKLAQSIQGALSPGRQPSSVRSARFSPTLRNAVDVTALPKFLHIFPEPEEFYFRPVIEQTTFAKRDQAAAVHIQIVPIRRLCIQNFTPHDAALVQAAHTTIRSLTVIAAERDAAVFSHIDVHLQAAHQTLRSLDLDVHSTGYRGEEGWGADWSSTIAACSSLIRLSLRVFPEFFNRIIQAIPSTLRTLILAFGHNAGVCLAPLTMALYPGQKLARLRKLFIIVAVPGQLAAIGRTQRAEVASLRAVCRLRRVQLRVLRSGNAIQFDMTRA